MSQRKVWTQKEDKILKFLREQRQEKKWSVIARIMSSQFNLIERTGKQCRQRYHNHLDSKINTSEWTQQQSQKLYQLHFQYGNKWSILAQNLPGRTDNAIKNHFYSNLRKSLRRINKIITIYFKDTYKQIKTKILYKIIETADLKFKSTFKVQEDVVQLCFNLKNSLFKLQQTQEELKIQQLQDYKLLISKIYKFIGSNKKLYQQHFTIQKDYLHPKSCLNLKKTKSSASNRSEQEASSQYSSSFGFSCHNSPYQSDCSQQDQQYKPQTRTRAKSQIQKQESEYGLLNKSYKSSKNHFQSINCLIQSMKISQRGNKFQNQTKSADYKMVYEKNQEPDLNYSQFNDRIGQKCQFNECKANIQNLQENQVKMDIEQNIQCQQNNYVVSPVSNQQQIQNYAFFEDFNFKIQIHSPKVSSDSNNSFTEEFF